jgi:hypothetical protein
MGSMNGWAAEVNSHRLTMGSGHAIRPSHENVTNAANNLRTSVV